MQHGFGTGDSPAPTIKALVFNVRLLAAELVAMRRELRTERLVVVHPDDGRELVYTEVLGSSVSLNVQFYEEGHDHHSDVALVSVDDDEGEAHVSLAGREDIVAMLSANNCTTDYERSSTGDLMLQTETRHRNASDVERRPRTETLTADTTGIVLRHDGGQVSAARLELTLPAPR